MISLGNRPERLSVFLYRDSSFLSSIEVTPGPWPDGTIIELELRATETDPSPTVWPATVEGAFARWELPSADVNDALNEGLEHVRLIYREADGTRLLWAEGVVVG